MKTYIDKDKLTDQMVSKGYKTYASLCRDAGVNVSTFNSVCVSKAEFAKYVVSAC